MLNNVYCVPDEKDPPNTPFNCLFFMFVSFGEEKNKMKFTANAALKYRKAHNQSD